MSCSERATVAPPDAQSPIDKQHEVLGSLGIGFHRDFGDSGESTSSPGHALHLPLSTSGTAPDSSWAYGSKFAFESGSTPECASNFAPAWESVWESEDFASDFASGVATASDFEAASRGITSEKLLIDHAVRLRLSSSSPDPRTQTATSHSGPHSPIQSMAPFLRPGVPTPPQDRDTRKTNIDGVGPSAQRLIRMIGQGPRGTIYNRPVPYVGPPEMPLMLERWFEEGLREYGPAPYGHVYAEDMAMGEEGEEGEVPLEDLDIRGFARVKPAVGVKKTVQKTASASWVSNTGDVQMEEEDGEERQKKWKDVDSQGFVRRQVPIVTGMTQNNHYEKIALESLGSEMNRTSLYGQIQYGYGQRLRESTYPTPCTLPSRPPIQQQVHQQHPLKYGGFQPHTTWAPQPFSQTLGSSSRNICNGANRGNTQVPSIIFNNLNSLDKTIQSNNRDDFFSKLFHEPPTSSLQHTVNITNETHVIYSNNRNNSKRRARRLLSPITSVFPDHVWCLAEVRKRTPPALDYGQQPPRSQPPPAGLRLASMHEPYLWLTPFPGNTPGLYDTLLTWQTTLRRLYARMGPPGKKTANLMKLHPMFPFPCAEPVCAPLVGARLFELGSEQDEPEKEIWRIGIRDATVANAGLTWNCVDVFDECGVADGRAMKGRNVSRDGVSESAYKYAVDARERAKTGEGRWCFLVIKGKLSGRSKMEESEDEDMPPYLVIAFPSVAVTRFTKSVEFLHHGDDGEMPLSAGFSRSATSTPDTIIARSPYLSPYSRGGTQIEVPKANGNFQRDFSLPEAAMVFQNTLAPAQGAGGQAIFNGHMRPPPSPGISNARSVSAPFPTVGAKKGRAPSNLRIDTTASYAAFGGQHQSHTTLTSTFRDLNVFNAGYLNPGYYPSAANSNYYSYPTSRTPTPTAISPRPYYRPVRRIVFHFEKCGDLPLIEGYKTDVCAWRDWLEAVGRGRGKLVLYEEVTNEVEETGMETGGRVVI